MTYKHDPTLDCMTCSFLAFFLLLILFALVDGARPLICQAIGWDLQPKKAWCKTNDPQLKDASAPEPTATATEQVFITIVPFPTKTSTPTANPYPPAETVNPYPPVIPVYR